MPDFPPCCVENVKNKGGKLCDWNSVCKPIQEALDKYCKDSGQNPCAPMPQMPNGQMCYCCCSCFAYNTPIEASLGEYVMVQDIVANVDEILAGSYAPGGAPNWQERLVDYSSGISAGPGEPELEFDYMFYITYQAEDGSTAPQSMIVTVDHMFLRPNGKVTPVQYLAPNDKIVASHGGFADVRFVVPARYKGGLHHIMFNGFDNESLDNHLLSANGVVTADYSVQLAYSTGNLNPALVDGPDQGTMLRASDRAYQARYANTEALAFIADRNLWPKGVTPIASESMINVPLYAKSYLTEAQAADIQANAPVLPPDNTLNVTTALWLFDVYGSFFSTPIYLVDWQNETPNAYTWETNRQRFILLTGGLLRVARFNQEGLAIIIAHLLAVAGGANCVGPADYDGVFSKLRQVWRDSLYFLTYSQGIEQIQALFGYVSEENAKANPADICAQPSLACRVQTMNAASSMMPLPSCANPDAYFGVVSAKSGKRYVAVAFNEPVNPESGSSTDNYAITGPEDGAVTVDSAEVDPLVPSEVRLCVTGLQPSTDYTVSVTNVVSTDGVLVDPEHASADFRTAKKPL